MARTELPAYRCLRCGYPIADRETLRCNECGRMYDQNDLEYWFGGEEQARFEHVMWLALGCLFLKLLLLPELRWVARVGAGIVLAWGSHVAMRGKPEGPGRYCGIGGVAVGVIMFVGFAWLPSPLPFYTFDMIGGCLLLLATLHNPVGGHVGGTLAARRLTPVLLFLVPIFSLACWQAGQAAASAAPATPPPGPVVPFLSPTLLQQYPPFDFLLPYLASIGVWVYVWRVLAGVRKMLFGPTQQSDE